MGAGFGEMKSVAKLEAKPIGKGPQGGDRDARVLRRRADVRHDHLVRRPWHVQPAVAGRRLVLGRKAYKEDMENRMARVRNEAKANMRRFVDDVSFIVSKESRRPTQGHSAPTARPLPGIANQTTRSLNESLQAALAAAKLEENERATRVKELERQLNILRQVTEHAVNLSPQPEAQPAPIAR